MKALAITAGILGAAAAAGATELPRVAMLGLTAGDGIADKQAQVLEDLLMNALYRTERFNLVGRSDIAGLIGFERQKQMLGCEGDNACVAEIAGALNVPVVAIASVARLGTKVVFAMKLVDTANARVLVRAGVTAAGDDKLEEAVDALARQVVAECDRHGCSPKSAAAGAAPPAAKSVPAAAAAPPVPPQPPAPSRGRGWWIAGAVAVAAAAAGTYFALDSRNAKAEMDNALRAPSDGTAAAAARMRTSAIAADALFGGAALAAAGGVVLFVWKTP